MCLRKKYILLQIQLYLLTVLLSIPLNKLPLATGPGGATTDLTNPEYMNVEPRLQPPVLSISQHIPITSPTTPTSMEPNMVKYNLFFKLVPVIRFINVFFWQSDISIVTMYDTILLNLGQKVEKILFFQILKLTSHDSNKLFQSSQNFCKCLAFSLEFQK